VMKLFDQGDQGEEDDDHLDIDMDDADTEELEAVAYRFVQIVPDRCEDTAKTMAMGGFNHPVVFLCDVGDHFGLAIARKVTTSIFIDQALKGTGTDERPGVISGIDLDDLEGKEPTIFDAIRGRMTGLLGYFPIVVAAKGGFSVFPWPFQIKEKSKFKLFP
jgi:hypothetical protein